MNNWWNEDPHNDDSFGVPADIFLWIGVAVATTIAVVGCVCAMVVLITQL